MGVKSYEFLKNKGLSKETTLQEAISDLLKSNGTEDSPDTPNFQAGIYSDKKSPYQNYMRKWIRKTIADSHRFPKHLKIQLEKTYYNTFM